MSLKRFNRFRTNTKENKFILKRVDEITIKSFH